MLIEEKRFKLNYTLALRLVVGWTYFSAFWRRIVLDYKLDPEVAGYIGEKFNHFLPHALFIKPQLEYLLLNPDLLWWVLFAFTIIEGVVGLLFMLGLFTRLMSLTVAGLAMGILLSAGWIGTTCLDEWQIGVLGLAGGIVIFFSGPDHYSLDRVFYKNKFILLMDLPAFQKLNLQKLILWPSLIILTITLGTNQIFHGGVWGVLHNKSVSPHLEITSFKKEQGSLHFAIQRTEGADVYGSFLYRLQVRDSKSGKILSAIVGEEWENDKSLSIKNIYIAKIRKSKFSLIIPLGAKANFELDIQDKDLSEAELELILTDINGKEWKKKEG